MNNVGICKSLLLSGVETILNEIVLSGVWINQSHLNVSDQWFKSKAPQILRDQYSQHWLSEITSEDIYCNDKMF